MRATEFSNEGSAAAVSAPSGGNTTGGGTTTTSQTFDPTDPSAIPDYGGIYGASQTAANTAFENAKIAIAAKRNGIMSQYGYGADGNVDGNNLLGLYQQNRRADATDLNNAENTALDRGLGLKGLGAQVAEAPQYDINVRDANLGGQYIDALHGTDLDLQNATDTHTQTLLDARNQEIQNAIQNGWFNAPTTTDSGSQEKRGPGSTAPNPSPRATKTAQRFVAAQKALAERSAGMNAKYGLGDRRPAKTNYKGRH